MTRARDVTLLQHNRQISTATATTKRRNWRLACHQGPPPRKLDPSVGFQLLRTWPLGLAGASFVRNSFFLSRFAIAARSWPASSPEQVVEHLEQSGFVIMKKPPSAGGVTLGRGLRFAATEACSLKNITRQTLVGPLERCGASDRQMPQPPSAPEQKDH
jgi:hypothetical protein